MHSSGHNTVVVVKYYLYTHGTTTEETVSDSDVFFLLFLCKTNALLLYIHTNTNEEARPRTMMMIQIMGHDQYIYKHFFCFSVFLYNSFLLFFQKYDKFLCTFLISKEGKEKNIIVH